MFGLFNVAADANAEAALTPETLKERRKLARALMERGSDTSPVAHWSQGATRLVDALNGVLDERSASKAEAGAMERAKAQEAALLGGFGGTAPTTMTDAGRAAPSPGGNDTYTGAPKGLFSSESGGRFDAQNNATGAGGMKGHFGRVQFGQARLQEAAAAGAIPEGTTPEQFMASPELQRAAERWHFADIDNTIKSSGMDRMMGQNINGVPITRDGLVAVAHLGGTKGMQKFVETGGRYNPSDVNGTSLMDYFSRMGGGRSQQAAPVPPADVPDATAQQAQFAVPGQPPQAAPAAPIAQPDNQRRIAAAIAVLNNPFSTPGAKAIAQALVSKGQIDPTEARLKQLQVQEAEAKLSDRPLTRRQLELQNQKAERELQGEGATPLTPQERAQFNIPEGQPAFKTRSGDIKFGPAATRVSVDASQRSETEFGKETGKALAKRFDEMVGDGDAAAQNLELVSELRRLGGKIDFGAPAVAKGFLGRLGIKTDGISDIEAFNTLISRLTPQQRLPGSGATSDFDAKMFRESLPQLINTPEGNTLVIDTIEKVSQNRMARGDIAMRVQTGEITPREGIAELRKLQAEARALSDTVRDFGKQKAGQPGTPAAAQPATAKPAQPQQGQPTPAEIEAEMKRRGLR